MSALLKLRWYLNRLRLMQVAELRHRGWALVAGTLNRIPLGREQSWRAPNIGRFGRAWCAGLPRGPFDDATTLCSAAERVLAGRWNVFALRDVPIGFPPEWNRDPLTGIVAPLRFGRGLDYRDESIVGNIKYLWEPARHLELVTLAQAWRATGEPHYIQGCKTLLDSWFDQCPFPLGAHWSSSLELAVRLVNWAVAWHLLDGAEGPMFVGPDGNAFLHRWLASIDLHQRFIAGNLSRFSSANNHLLGELMGLLVASVTWPCWPESEEWRRASSAEFEVEALRQTWEDGVNKEQAFYYHHEVADMMLLCALFGQANAVQFGAMYWRRLEAMLEFIDAVMDVGGHVPMVGDADDALMVRFDPSTDFDAYRSLLCTGAELFDRPEWKRGTRLDAKTQWLLGTESRRLKREPAVPSESDTSKASLTVASCVQTHAFRQGGYWIMAYAEGTPDEVKLVADAGPLGYLSIAAHGHADALAFVLSLGGHPVLIDPGTYAYHTQRKWRDYFRGTSAHNTLCVDGMDQSEIGGSFMWLRKADARCLKFSFNASGADWLAEHDGYTRLLDPVVHRRRIQFRPTEGRIRVTDILTSTRNHRLEWHWHFGPKCAIEPQGNIAVSAIGAWVLRLCLPDKATGVTLHRGSDDPPLGWVSQHFDRKEPTTTLRCESCITGGDAEFVTELLFERKQN